MYSKWGNICLWHLHGARSILLFTDVTRLSLLMVEADVYPIRKVELPGELMMRQSHHNGR